MLIELLELKEPHRLDFKKKINDITKLADIDVDSFAPIYKDVIEVSGAESMEDLYTQEHKEQLNRDMYLRLKLQNINQLRKKDAEKIKNLEDQIAQLMNRISLLEKKSK